MKQIDSFLDVYVSKETKRLDCLLPSTDRVKTKKDWYSLVDPAQDSSTFPSNIKKVCFIFEHKLQSDILWPSFVGYVLLHHSRCITKDLKLVDKTPKYDKYDNIGALFHNRLSRRRKTFREACYRNFKLHISTIRNEAGGMGKKTQQWIP